MPVDYFAPAATADELKVAAQNPQRAADLLARHRIETQMAQDFGSAGTHGTPGLTGKTYAESLAQFNQMRRDWMAQNPQAQQVYQQVAPETSWLKGNYQPNPAYQPPTPSSVAPSVATPTVPINWQPPTPDPMPAAYGQRGVTTPGTQGPSLGGLSSYFPPGWNPPAPWGFKTDVEYRKAVVEAMLPYLPKEKQIEVIKRYYDPLYDARNLPTTQTGVPVTQPSTGSVTVPGAQGPAMGTIPNPQAPWRTLPQGTPSPAWYTSMVQNKSLPSWIGPNNLPIPSARTWREMAPSEQQGYQGLAQTMGVYYPDLQKRMAQLQPSWVTPYMTGRQVAW